MLCRWRSKVQKIWFYQLGINLPPWKIKSILILLLIIIILIHKKQGNFFSASPLPGWASWRRSTARHQLFNLFMAVNWLYQILMEVQGAKKVIFTACHQGKLKLAFASPNIISTSPQNFGWAEFIPLGKLRTQFTGPIAKSTSPGLSDTTFFARWSKKHSPVPNNEKNINYPWWMYSEQKQLKNFRGIP